MRYRHAPFDETWEAAISLSNHNRGWRAMDIFEVFRDRVKRRLDELAEEAHREVVRIAANAAANGSLASTTRVLLQLDAIKNQIHRAIDWALSEANSLPKPRDITCHIIFPSLQSSLIAHIDELYGFVNLSGLIGMIGKTKEEHHAKQKEALIAELREFSEGVWHPRNVAGSSSSMTTNNTLNVHGDVQGTVQQAGGNSNQHATFNMEVKSVDAALDRFVTALADSDVGSDIRSEMTAEVDSIRIQLKRSKPNLSVVQAAVSGLQQLAISVSANVLTPYIIPLLVAVGLN